MKFTKIFLLFIPKLISFILVTFILLPLFLDFEDRLSFSTYLKVWFYIFLEKEEELVIKKGGEHND